MNISSRMAETDRLSHKRRNYQLLLHVSGGAGTGKSFLIKCLSELFKDDECILTAPTGTAAFQIFGETNHRAFRLPVHRRGSRNDNSDLSGNAARELQDKYKPALVFVMDEKSMIGVRQLGKIDERLRDIFPENRDRFFGGASIVLFGDYGQLPPVGDVAVYSGGKNIKETDKLAQAGQAAYAEFSDAVVLTQSERQRNDLRFANLLNNLRNGVCNDADFHLLRTRFVGAGTTITELGTTFKRAVHLFTTNEKVAEHNAKELFKLRQPIARILAEHTGGVAAQSAPNDDARGLPVEIELCVGARVMLTSNEWTQAGLTNGSVGKVEGIVYTRQPQTCSTMPECVIVQFDGFIGASVLPDIPRCVAISPMQVTWQSTTGQQLSRKQFPLKLAWAFTVHKSQGWTFDKVVVDIGDKEYAPALAYVALSRVRTLYDLILKPFTMARFRLCAKSQLIRPRIIEENRIASIDQHAPMILVPQIVEKRCRQQTTANRQTRRRLDLHQVGDSVTENCRSSVADVDGSSSRTAFQMTYEQLVPLSNVILAAHQIQHYRRISAVPDGNCMFRSLAFFLCDRNMERYEEVKQKLISFVILDCAPTALWEDVAFRFESFDDYLHDTADRMGQVSLLEPNAYGNGHDILILTILLNLPITVVRRGQSADKREFLLVEKYQYYDKYPVPRASIPAELLFPDYISQPIILYYNGWDHYDILAL